jgi:hypothetical protein
MIGKRNNRGEVEGANDTQHVIASLAQQSLDVSLRGRRPRLPEEVPHRIICAANVPVCPKSWHTVLFARQTSASARPSLMVIADIL